MLPRLLRPIAPLFAALAGLAAGCTAGEPVAPGACASCGTGEFCCLDRCLPLGSTCGTADGGVGGSGGTGGAPSDPCAPHGNAAVVARACVDGATFTTCPSPSENPCNSGNVCVEWVDATGRLEADCVDPSRNQVCDPLTDVSHCEGTSARYCNATPTTTGVHPPGFWSTSDCPALYGPHATCVASAGGGPSCDDPTATPCDPATYAASLRERLRAGSGWQVGREAVFVRRRRGVCLQRFDGWTAAVRPRFGHAERPPADARAAGDPVRRERLHPRGAIRLRVGPIVRRGEPGESPDLLRPARRRAPLLRPRDRHALRPGHGSRHLRRREHGAGLHGGVLLRHPPLPRRPALRRGQVLRRRQSGHLLLRLARQRGSERGRPCHAVFARARAPVLPPPFARLASLGPTEAGLTPSFEAAAPAVDARTKPGDLGR